ncbi:MAG: EF-hand domain-containing protein [Gammaproteobacteria bacterium]|nr:EF-hand domain-containing protein [Gammaproteobacteria bacterium]MDE0226910.1 EF-hand domain-containing protein [Gammaproteobacteria bacterium]MDE0452610.1 EF-hand domain-containing protein [Gammaproteobacteria bacterium]
MQGQVVSVGLVVGMCVTLAAFTALADDSDKKKGMDRSIDIAEMKAGAAERLAKVDTDGDGEVSPEEFAAARMDRGEARGEGRRWREARERRGQAMRKRMREGMRERREMLSGPVFDAADGDGDGKLSKDEFDQLPQAARSVAQRRAFDRVDADGDGVLTASELSPRVAMLEKADADGDGKVSREEMRALRKARADGDGKKKRGWRKVRKSGDADADKTE